MEIHLVGPSGDPRPWPMAGREEFLTCATRTQALLARRSNARHWFHRCRSGRELGAQLEEHAGRDSTWAALRVIEVRP